jgi:molecular chaperone GrpE
VSQAEQGHNGEEPRVVVRDRRRIDPATGAVRTPDPSAAKHASSGLADAKASAGPTPGEAGTADGAAGAADGEVGKLRSQLDERTSDLQRITAEYANYRRRVERDREAVTAAARATVVAELLPVLDDIERAKAHGDLNGAFKAVADKLVTTLEKSGLTAFGSEGDEFNPAVHQAVQHSTSPDVEGPTVSTVLRRGYQLGERLLRTAMVGVTDHEPVPEPDGAVQDHVDGVDSEKAPLQAGPAVDHNPVQRDQD